MQVDGFPVEKFKCRVSGTIEITEAEGTAMPLDRIVVMLVAARSDNYVPKLIEEDGTAMITRVVKLEHLALLEGDMREMALQALITGDNNALQGSLEFPGPQQKAIDPETGEVSTVPVAAYAEPPANDAVAPQNDAVFAHGSEQPVSVASHVLEDDTFDVPVAKDDGTMTGPRVIGHVHVGGTVVPADDGSESEGPKVGKVDYSELASISTTPQQTGPVPQGDVVGSVHRPGKTTDEHLAAFFEETDPRG